MLLPVLALALNFSIFHWHPASKPVVTCGIHTVSYRFVGEPGMEFTYRGTKYVVPASGWIELLAHGEAATYQVADRALPLSVWPLDDFGTRTVPLPKRGAIESTQTSELKGEAR